MTQEVIIRLTASTVGMEGFSTTADNDTQRTLTQEEATETKADEDTGKNTF